MTMVKVQLFGGPADGTVIDAMPEQAEHRALTWAHTTALPTSAPRPADAPPTPPCSEFCTYRWDGSYTRDGTLRFVLVPNPS